MDSLTPHDHFQQAFSFDEPNSSPAHHRVCTGPCRRTLPATAEFFYRDKYSKDGLETRCKECDQAKKNKGTRPKRKILRVEVPPGHKLCVPCEQIFPATTEYFHADRSKKDGLTTTCKACQSKRQKNKIHKRNIDRGRYRTPLVDIPEGMKRCSGQCGQLKPATPEFFQRDKQKKDGLYPYCKTCLAEKRNTPESRIEKHVYNQSYLNRPGMRDQINARRRDLYHTDPEVRQKALDRNKLPEVQEYNKAYLKEYNKTPTGRAKNKANKHRYRAREKSVPGTHNDKQIQELLKRQKYKCYYCHKKFEKKNGNYVYNIEHTFPISRVAGTDIPANDISYLVLACYPCNRDKGNKFPWEYPEGGRLC